MLVLKQAGYEVVSVYMTKGEAGIPGKTHEESSAIRVEEATKASEMLGARPVFMTQIDGSTEMEFKGLLLTYPGGKYRLA